MNRHHFRCGLQAGFTLVELLLVILILSSLALVTTFMVDNMNEQFRFDQTKSRLEQIRRAIIGDSARTLNGQPEISGFVADMGRLPVSLSELIEAPADEDQLWGEQEVTLSGTIVGYLYGGWRGPYLETLPESESGKKAFRDGWGNPDMPGNEDNYGWEFSGLSGVVAVRSLGADGATGQADLENPYHKDYPVDGSLVNEMDWHVNLANQPFRMQLNRITTDQHALQLMLLSLRNGNETAPPVTGDFDVTLSGVASQMLEGNFVAADAYVPLGAHMAVVVCAGTEIPYDGNCPSAVSVARPQPVKIVPRSYTPPLQFEWNTQ